jgi:hypothetical protein
MATFKGTNATKRLSVPSEKVAVDNQGGRLRSAHDTLVSATTGALAATDIVKMGLIPKGAKVYDCRADITDAFTTGASVDVGWSASTDGSEAANPTGLFSNIALTATARNELSASAAGMYKEFAAEVDIIVTADGVVSNDGILAVTVIYALD